MPPGERTPLRAQPIGAGRRQPGKRPRQVRRELQAISHPPPAVRVIRTAAGVRVEEPTGNVGEMNRTRVLVLELDQAAAPAAVAKALPFPRIERLERLGFPKGSFLVCHAIAATRWLIRHSLRPGGSRGVAPYRPDSGGPQRMATGLWTGHKIATIAPLNTGERERRRRPHMIRGARGEGQTCLRS
jgi:hypothetical protein